MINIPCIWLASENFFKEKIKEGDGLQKIKF